MTEPVVPYETFAPRTLDQRFRLYVQAGRQLTLLATAATPAGLGCALVQQHADCAEAGLRLDDLGVVGVLDVCPDGVEWATTGEWIVNPFGRSEGAVTFGPKERLLR